jgi:hypothetical protein
MESTSLAPQVLPTSGACAREYVRPSTGAWIPTGVVTADLRTTLHGTGMSFVGRTVPAAAPRVTTTRPRKNSVSGISTSGPPV